MADVLWKIYNSRIAGFNQEVAGYYTSVFGFLNLVTRPLGGYIGDVVYRTYGTKGKKWWTLICGILMGGSCIGGGFYLSNHTGENLPSLPILMGVFSVAAIFSELGNGANFALVPHCNSYNNGVMSGIVGSFGNLGGIVFAMCFRFQPHQGNGFWIMGIICLVLNLVLIPIPVPKY
jgi:NNP family nitrate/nitrite transporter-like MFS transporter